MSAYGNYQDVAVDACLTFGVASENHGTVWSACGDHPYISTFAYEILAPDDEFEPEERVGTVDGFRISQNWVTEDELLIWDQADAISGDAVRYVDAVIRELRAFDALDGLGPALTSLQRVTIVRHVHGVDQGAPHRVWTACVASLLLMDAPRMIVVDPRGMPDERDASGALAARGRTHDLLRLGLSRMVGAPLLWGWDRELSESLMESYSYDAMREARLSGQLDGIIDAQLWKEVYEHLGDDHATSFDLPSPDDLDE